MNQPEEFVIETYGLTKNFGEVQALRGVDLKVPLHSIFGFLGPNGAGKTTLMKTLLGLCQLDSGSGKIFGCDIKTENLAIREKIGYLPQQPQFFEHLTAYENLQFAAKFFFCGPKLKVKDRCHEMLKLVGLEKLSDRLVKGFSGGEKQRLGIAMAQINFPDLLILDEPVSALDPLGRQAVLEIMDRLRKYTTIFYSTHILDDVQRISDAVGIMNHGQIVASGSIDQILNIKNKLVFTISLLGSNEELANRLATIPWIIDISVAQQKKYSIWQVSVDDESLAEASLLRFLLSDSSIIVLEFKRKKYELEDVFLDIVQGEKNV